MFDTAQGYKLPAPHSKLGASGAERWMHCPGSVELIKSLSLPESDEEDWRRDGQLAHKVAALCLTNPIEPWEIAGQEIDGLTVSAEITNAVFIYVQACQPFMASPRYLVRVEAPVHIPGHKDAFGTCDFGSYDTEERHLLVLDYKHGVGVYVDARANPQIRYYGRGMLEEFPDAERITLGICQPRITWAPSPVRWGETLTKQELLDWSDQELLPAMRRTEVDPSLIPGEHCRFCPAKLACPVLQGIAGAALTGDPKQVPTIDDAAIQLGYKNVAVLKMYIKAVEQEAMRRALAGAKFTELKLVKKKADRVFKVGAETVLAARLGDAIYSKPEMKSPAQIEKIGGAAIGLVQEWAFTPDSGVTLALRSDPRPEAPPPDPTKSFAAALDKEAKAE